MDPAEVKKLKNKVRMLRALLMIRNGKVSGKIYHVRYDSDSKQWTIQLEGSNKNLASFRLKSVATDRAKELAKKAYVGQAFIYNKDGTPQKAHTYVDEKGKAKERARKRLERERRRRRRWGYWY
jgi:hypothetical protein